MAERAKERKESRTTPRVMRHGGREAGTTVGEVGTVQMDEMTAGATPRWHQKLAKVFKLRGEMTGTTPSWRQKLARVLRVRKAHSD